MEINIRIGHVLLVAAVAILVLTSFCLVGKGSTGEWELIKETTHGKIEGELIKVSDTFSVEAYRGIPYAAAPCGKLLFRKPVKPNRWEGIKATKNWPPRCIQSWVLGDVLPKMDTDSCDCLYLNLYTPHHEKSSNVNEKYAVMVWIHGGGYHFGSTLEYGLKGITSRIVPKGVVFVSVQYRLGAYGFYSTGDSECSGNFGLWDQRMALEWVQENVKHFNGDPNLVTVFGESAGAGSTALLTLSPHSNQLFQQAILMSGSVNAPWAINNGPLKHGKLLAENLGCYQRDSASRMDCLRTKSPDDLLKAEEQVAQEVLQESQMLFNPIPDDEFFMGKNLTSLLREAPKKPTISGTTQDEMGLFLTPPSQNLKWNWRVSEDQISPAIIEGLLQNLIDPTETRENGKELTDLAKEHYLCPANSYSGSSHFNSATNTSFLIQQYTKAFSDAFLFYPQYIDAKARMELGHPVWLYSFDYFTEKAFPKGHKHQGAYHLMELPYLFESFLFNPYQFDDVDNKVSENLVTLWTNFAKHGDPTKSVDDATWPKISNVSPGHYLRISESLSLHQMYNLDCVSLWGTLAPVPENFTNTAS